MQEYKFSVDSTFQIGSYHVNGVSPCQDYADTMVSEQGDKALLVISDGCSSGGKTDVGARILAHRYLVQATQNKKEIPLEITKVNLTRRDLSYLGLKIEDFLATLVTIEANQKMITANVAGDGVMVFEMINGDRFIYQIEWANNTPGYPVYFTDAGKAQEMPARFAIHHADNGEPMMVKMISIKNGQVSESIWGKTPQQNLVDGLAPTIFSHTGDQLKMVAIFSDGVDQIRSTENPNLRIPLIEVVQKCLDFKNTNGSFVKRRIRKQMADWKKGGYEPFDDLSCAVLLIEENEAGEVRIAGEEVTDGN